MAYNNEFLLFHPSVVLATNASGNWGCGAVWTSHWFHLKWDGTWSNTNIAVKELVSIILAAAIWGRYWTHQKALVLSDNMAVVQIFQTKSSWDREMMHLLCCLHFIKAKWDMVLWVQHIRGKSNIAADALPCNSVQVFFQVLPNADQQQTVLPMQDTTGPCRTGSTRLDIGQLVTSFCSMD